MYCKYKSSDPEDHKIAYQYEMQDALRCVNDPCQLGILQFRLSDGFRVLDRLQAGLFRAECYIQRDT